MPSGTSATSPQCTASPSYAASAARASADCCGDSSIASTFNPSSSSRRDDIEAEVFVFVRKSAAPG